MKEPGPYLRNHPHFQQGIDYAIARIMTHLNTLEDAAPEIDNYVTFPTMTTEQIRNMIKRVTA